MPPTATAGAVAPPVDVAERVWTVVVLVKVSLPENVLLSVKSVEDADEPPLGVVVAMILPFGSTARNVPAAVPRLGSHSVVAVRRVVVAFEKISFPVKVLLSPRRVEEADDPPPVIQVPLTAKQPLVRLMPPAFSKVEVEKRKVDARCVARNRGRERTGVVVPTPRKAELLDCQTSDIAFLRPSVERPRKWIASRRVRVEHQSRTVGSDHVECFAWVKIYLARASSEAVAGVEYQFVRSVGHPVADYEIFSSSCTTIDRQSSILTAASYDRRSIVENAHDRCRPAVHKVQHRA